MNHNNSAHSRVSREKKNNSPQITRICADWKINIEFYGVERKLIYTSDGSHSISIPEMKVTYHSIHGAVRESNHVFLQEGFAAAVPNRDSLHILEVGLGTGLNALLTLVRAGTVPVKVCYTALELYPLSPVEARSLNYCEIIQRADLAATFLEIHDSPWDRDISLTPFFQLKKLHISLTDYHTDNYCDLVYFDAFAPAAQPELWTTEIFEKIYRLLNPGGILVTYCSKSVVRKAMQASGFTVEKRAGPPGKREMLRAFKR